MRTIRIITAITLSAFAAIFLYTAATDTTVGGGIVAFVLTVVFATGAWFVFPKQRKPTVG